MKQVRSFKGKMSVWHYKLTIWLLPLNVLFTSDSFYPIDVVSLTFRWIRYCPGLSEKVLEEFQVAVVQDGIVSPSYV